MDEYTNEYTNDYGVGIERETLINFNEVEKTASVNTCNKKLMNKLRQLAKERPDECKVIEEFEGGRTVEFEVPKKVDKGIAAENREHDG